MRAVVEKWLARHWYGGRRPPWLLRALVPVYRAGYRWAQQRAPGPASGRRPLVVVGNITVGGTGKTPLVIRLCQLAREAGLRPAVISIGYRRRGRATQSVLPGSDPRVCGDEAVLLAQRTGVPVVVAARRRDALRALGGTDVDLVFSDDGLQQADLARDGEICVIDGERGLGNGLLLPAGPLREPVDRLGRVDYVISNGAWRDAPPGLQVVAMRLQPSVLRSLDGREVYRIDEFRNNVTGNRIHAYAGIGNPGRFFEMLRSLGLKVEAHPYADHHRYRRRDFAAATAGEAIVMTEKDAVKCRALGLENAWCVPVDAALPPAFEAELKARLRSLGKDSA